MAIETRHPDVFVDEVAGVQRILGVGATTAAFVGRTKKGPTSRATLISSRSEFESRYGDRYLGPSFSYMADSIKGYYEEGGLNAYICRVLGDNAAKAQGDMKAYGTGPTAGSVLSGATQPFVLAAGQTLVIAPDGGGNQTFTFAATQAVSAGSGAAFGSIVGSETLQLKVNGGPTITVTFLGGDTTALAVSNRINAALNAAGAAGAAVVNGAQVDIRSDRFGTGASIQILAGGTGLADIGQTPATHTGTGDAFDIQATTAAEVVTKLSTGTGFLATAEGGAVRLTSSTTGSSSSIQVKNTSTALALTFDNTLHSGAASAPVFSVRIKAGSEGAWGNDVVVDATQYTTTTTATLSNSGTSVVLASVRNVELGDLLLITDPANGNEAVVHVYAINAGTRTVSFQACALKIPGTPLASGSTVACATMHRRVTTLATATLSGDTTIALKQASGIAQGAIVTIDDGTHLKEATVLAISGNSIRLDSTVGAVFASGTMVATQEFGLNVFEEGTLIPGSPFQYLSPEATNVQDYFATRLAGESNESIYEIEAVDLDATPTPLFHRAPRPGPLRLSGGDDGDAPTSLQLVGAATTGSTPASGLHLLDPVRDVNRFCAPGITDPTFVLGASAYADSQIHKDALSYYFAAPATATTTERLLQFRNFDTNLDSTQAMMYAPWTKERDPSNPKGIVLQPPEGRVLGRVADTIANRGVHVAAANVTLHVLGLAAEITDGMQDELNEAGVNLIRFFPGDGIRIWGARTQGVVTDGRQYQPVRELLNFVKLSFVNGMRFAVFEPNDPRLWRAIERAGRDFLSSMWRQGQLFPSDDETRAYFIKCDSETNTQQTISEGKVISEVGVNPPLPAELVVFRVGVFDGGSSVEEEILRRG